jgi:outer membrane protein
MKRFAGILALIIAFTFSGQKTSAQSFKFGHINRDELIKTMPEYDSAVVKLQNFQKELTNALELMQVELNNKADAYTKESKNLSDLVRQTKEQELNDINKRIQDFQTNAQTQLTDKQAALFNPIVDKVQKAIKDVGKENGFTYIFEGISLYYFDETKSVNITPLVKTKLGLK